MTFTENDCIKAIEKSEQLLGRDPSMTKYYDLYKSGKVEPSPGTIQYVMGGWNVAKEMAGSHTVEQWESTCSVNEEYFKDLTEESAYWFGFLYADGCLKDRDFDGYSTFLELGKKDGEHVHRFSDDIESDYTIQETTHQSNDGGVCVQITNTEFSNHLIEKGLTPSSKESIPRVPNNLRKPFLRGYYDGDGGMTGSTWRITMTDQKRCNEFISWLHNMGVDARSFSTDKVGPYGKKDKHYVYVSKKDEIRKITDLLWPNGVNTEPCLRRKATQLVNI